MVSLYEFTRVQRPPVSSSGNKYQLHTSPRPLFPRSFQPSHKTTDIPPKEIIQTAPGPGRKVKISSLWCRHFSSWDLRQPSAWGCRPPEYLPPGPFKTLRAGYFIGQLHRIASVSFPFPFFFSPFLFLTSRGFLLYFMVIVPHSQPRKLLVFRIEVRDLDRFTHEGRPYDWT